MAEERLIDDDKDRRYKIRVNENGEEELVVNAAQDEDEREEIGFEVPDFDTDDEEAAVMTPEQLAARQKAREEEESKRHNMTQQYISRAKACLATEDYSGAIYALEQAGELDANNGEVYALKVKAYSRYFTDWSALDECADAADGLGDFGNDEQKRELAEMAKPLEERILQTKQTVEALNRENEEKKGERRAAFKQRRKSALIAFAATVLPFVAFLIAAVVLGTQYMYTREDSLFTILTIVFASLAGVAFIATVITSRRLWAACRNVSRNERNVSTKLGREYEEKSAEYEKLTRIYASFNVIDNLNGEV